MNMLLMGGLVLVIVLIVHSYRRSRDRDALFARVRDLGGEATAIRRVRRGHPFPSTGRGWWAWRVSWRDGRGERLSWALTTREGIRAWEDAQ